MRAFPAGFMVLALASSAFAQVRGEVESIGFGSSGYYRPECWTPMVVRLDSTIDDPAEYRIEVHQRDLDFDHVIYVKQGITLNPHTTQRWELCFLPEPTNGGLPDGSIPELQNRLRVYLTSKDGSKQLLQLPITSPVNSLEMSSGGFTRVKGQKLILAITEGGSTIATKDYEGAIGLSEFPNFVRLPTARQLPQSVLAYQAVDAVLWVHGDARVLSEQGSTQLVALQQWVRQGGMLVICQPGSDGERQLITPFADMLPIQWQEDGQWKVSNQDKDDLEPLTKLATRDNLYKAHNWKIKGPFAFARAKGKPIAIVAEWIDWKSDKTPYIVRIPYGLGSVTWVAQDLGDPKLSKATDTGGWPYVWDKVFGWANATRVAGDFTENDQKDYSEGFAGPGALDLGWSQLKGVEFVARGATLIIIAVFFFIVYWIVAGPGTYLFLAGKKRKQHSWAAFGFVALGGTVLTVLIVRLVLRGSPEVRHASNVRIVSGQTPQPAIIYSRVGLYIPRDGVQQVNLGGTATDFVSYITPLAQHPSYVPDNEFPANLDYRVPVRDAGAADLPEIDVPFRSTLKKLQAKWCGDMGMTVRANSIKLNLDVPARDALSGSLDNLSGIDFRNVYIAFHYREGEEYVLYLPYWNSGTAANRNRIEFPKAYANADQLLGYLKGTQPNDKKPCRGDLRLNWKEYWQIHLQGNERVDDMGVALPLAFPVLSFFDRLPPAKNDKSSSSEAFTMLRRGMHNLNMSAALEAGELVILAEADNRPLPYPLMVNGSKVEGDGTVFYQFALPIERIEPPPPAPTTAPATTAPVLQSPAAR